MIVYLDMDGVLVNFHKGVFDIFNQPYKYDSSLANYDFWEDWNRNITRESINSKCNCNFWSNLEWMSDGLEIFGTIASKFLHKEIYLLTDPKIGSEKTPTGKLIWIKKYLPGFYNQTIITQVSKKLFANSNTLLIDDNTKNVDEFHQAGGQTILVPRPWNSLHLLAHKSVEIVKQQLAEIKC